MIMKIKDQNSWYAAKAMLKAEFIALNVFIRIQKNLKIKDVMPPSKIRKKDQIKSSIRQKIIKPPQKTYEIKNEQTKKKERKKISETKSWFLEKINKVDKYLVSLSGEKRKRAKIIKWMKGGQKVQTSSYKINVMGM